MFPPSIGHLPILTCDLPVASILRIHTEGRLHIPCPRKALHVSHLLPNLTVTWSSRFRFGNGYLHPLAAARRTQKLYSWFFSLFPLSDFTKALTHSDVSPSWKILSHTSAHPKVSTVTVPARLCEQTSLIVYVFPDLSRSTYKLNRVGSQSNAPWHFFCWW